MLTFIPFKSKQFISVISLCSERSKTKRYHSQLQTKVNRNNHYSEYTIHGKRHRDDLDENGKILSASIWSDGTQFWYKNGRCHRNDRDENGRVLPASIYSSGSQYWYKNGKLHRDDFDEKGRVLPALIKSNGDQWWYKNGELY